MRWEKKTVDQTEVREIAERYEIDLITATILSRRGIVDPGEVSAVLERDLRFLHNPFLFVEMEDAVDRILQAIEAGERIFVFGDRDVDGITSTALLVDALRDYGAEVLWAVPMGDNAYGLTAQTIEEACEAGVELLIAVDCGTSNGTEIRLASEHGVDAIVLDHHRPHQDLPVAVAVINPRMEDSGYPFEYLSACGVAAKLHWALAFSRTSFYGRDVVLLNVRPVNEAYAIDAVKLRNLVEIDRLNETIVPGVARVENSRLAEFAEGCEVVVHDSKTVVGQLRRCFGQAVEIQPTDLAPMVAESFGALAGRSLLGIREKSRLGRYQKLSEIDVLANLFVSLVMKRENLLEESRRHLDLVALATLADNMPLTGENRILVKNGMHVLEGSRREGLRRLMLKRGLLGKKLDAKAIVWNVSPLINATGRMGEPDCAVKLLLADKEEDLDEQVEHIVGLNNQRRRMEERLWSVIQSEARRSHELTEGRFVVVTDDKVERGVTGLLASRLSRLFRVPALVATRLGDRVVASLRSPKHFSLKRFLDHFADLFTDYGGHDFAAGFNMPAENMQVFEERLYSSLQMSDPGEPSDEVLRIDAEIPHRYLTPALFRVAETFEPYGEGNPPLTFLTKELLVLDIQFVGKRGADHLKLLLGCGEHKWPAIWWNAADRAETQIKLDDRIDVVYRLSRSEWRGNSRLQLTVIDAR
jgi:single-stranded-DNA-specific exonuclease